MCCGKILNAKKNLGCGCVDFRYALDDSIRSDGNKYYIARFAHIVGDDKAWTEIVKCPFCGELLHQ